MKFDRPSDVRWVAKRGHFHGQEAKSCRSVVIGSADPWRTLGLFAIMFPGKMPRLRTLLMKGNVLPLERKPGEMHADAFHYLSTFVSITHLSLDWIKFPSVHIFGRLVCALPSLKTLRLEWVTFKGHDYNAGMFLRRPRNLTTLGLCLYDLATMHDVCDFLVATEMASTLKEIISRKPISLDEIVRSGISSLVSSAGASLHSTSRFMWIHGLSQEALL